MEQSEFKIIEGCCGTAALTFHLCGIKQQIITYQGSKWNYREELDSIIRMKGFSGTPTKVELYDPAPWSKVIPVLISDKERVIQELKIFEQQDPLNVFKKLNNSYCSKDPIKFAAEFLFLQRLSFSGKAVGYSGGIWNSPGFNKTSAYGIPGTTKFGAVKPMIPGLIKRLEKNDLKIPLTHFGDFLHKPTEQIYNTVVYLDPPYLGVTKYPDGDLSRQELVDLSISWYEAGATVLVSESEIIKELRGWNVICISDAKKNKSSFKNKKAEFVMISP
jgi:site-specific DNA-adenine methylase